MLERECLNDFKQQRQNEENELEKIRNEVFKKKVAELNQRDRKRGGRVPMTRSIRKMPRKKTPPKLEDEATRNFRKYLPDLDIAAYTNKNWPIWIYIKLYTHSICSY